MGLFSSEAHATLYTVSNFAKEVENFSNETTNSQQIIDKKIYEEKQEVDSIIEKLNLLYQECQNLYKEIQRRKKEIEEEVAAAEAIAESTPKEIEVTKTDSEGNQTTVTQHNPAYDVAQRNLREANTRLNRIKDLSYKVYNKRDELKNSLDQALIKQREIEVRTSELDCIFNEIMNKNRTASSSIGNTISAIEDYLSVTFNR